MKANNEAEYTVHYEKIISDEAEESIRQGRLTKLHAMHDLQALGKAARSEISYNGLLFWLKATGEEAKDGAFELIFQRNPKRVLYFYTKQAEAPTKSAKFRLEGLAVAICKVIDKIQRELDHCEPAGTTIGDIAA